VTADIPDLDTPQPDISDFPMDTSKPNIPQPNASEVSPDIHKLDIPQFDQSESGPGLGAHPGSQTLMGLAGTGDDQDMQPEPQDIISTIDLPALQSA
jgi:hypothetical protein